MRVLGIDPGFSGAFCLTNGADYLHAIEMPLIVSEKEKEVDFEMVRRILGRKPSHIFMERAVSFGMGTKGAFNYGRAFESVYRAVKMSQIPFTLVEPGKWTKEMHQGISKDLKPKVKSIIAVKRLFPRLVGKLPVRPKKKDLFDGPVDALLIAGYGLRCLNLRHSPAEELNFL